MSIEKLDLQSPDKVKENFQKLAELFPNCVTESAEGKSIDFDLLKQELKNEVVEGNKERYRLEWPGKREAIVTANLPTTGTLRPIVKDSVDFDNTENLYIEGDNLEVLKLLQESYLGKIKMIYIDPPYNTGKDFIYKDNFTQNAEEYKQESGQVDENKLRLFQNPETAGRYHSDWLTMMYPRLKLARNLLTDDGVIFISIDDNEVHNLRKICDEIFGAENFVAEIANINNPKGRSDDKFIATAHEYILIYAKNIDLTKLFGFEPEEKIVKRYNKLDKFGKKYREMDLRKTGDADKRSDRPDMYYYFFAKKDNLSDLVVSKTYTDFSDRIVITPSKEDGSEGRWRWGFQTAVDKVQNLYAKYMPNRKIWGIFEIDYLDEREPTKPTSSWMQKDVNSERGSEQMIDLGFSKEFFLHPKPIGTLKRIIEIGTLPKVKSIVLDFFSGSAGVVQALFELNLNELRNLNFIMVQIPQLTKEDSEAYKAGYKNICEIGKERIRRAGKKIKEGIVDAPNVSEDEDSEELDFPQSAISNQQSAISNQQSAISNQQSAISNQQSDSTDTGVKQKLEQLDIGFRVLRLDSSNLRDVYYKPQDIKQEDLELFSDNLKEDRTPEDILFQILLDWGLPLSLKIKNKIIAGKKVFLVADNSLYACFEKGIDENFAREVSKDKPLRIVFRDSGFKDDTAKTNVQQLLKQLSPETEVRVF